MKTTKIILITVGFALFFLSMVLLFEPTNGPTGFFVYTPNLAIINYNNNVPLDNNLEIEFMTRGTNNLTIIPAMGEIEFLELKCNNQLLSPFMEDNVIVVKDYYCEDNSHLLVKVLSKELSLELKFGDRIQAVKNTAPQSQNTAPASSSCGCGK